MDCFVASAPRNDEGGLYSVADRALPLFRWIAGSSPATTKRNHDGKFECSLGLRDSASRCSCSSHLSSPPASSEDSRPWPIQAAMTTPSAAPTIPPSPRPHPSPPPNTLTSH